MSEKSKKDLQLFGDFRKSQKARSGDYQESFEQWEKHFDYDYDRQKEQELAEQYKKNGAERKRLYWESVERRRKENARRLAFCKQCTECGNGKRTDIVKNGGCSCQMA